MVNSKEKLIKNDGNLDDSILLDDQNSYQLNKTPNINLKNRKLQEDSCTSNGYTLMLERQRKQFESLASTTAVSRSSAKKHPGRKASIFDLTSQKVKDIMKFDLPELPPRFNRSMMTNYTDMPQLESLSAHDNEGPVASRIEEAKHNSVGFESTKAYSSIIHSDRNRVSIFKQQSEVSQASPFMQPHFRIMNAIRVGKDPAALISGEGDLSEEAGDLEVGSNASPELRKQGGDASPAPVEKDTFEQPSVQIPNFLEAFFDILDGDEEFIANPDQTRQVSQLVNNFYSVLDEEDLDRQNTILNRIARAKKNMKAQNN